MKAAGGMGGIGSIEIQWYRPVESHRKPLFDGTKQLMDRTATNGTSFKSPLVRDRGGRARRALVKPEFHLDLLKGGGCVPLRAGLD